MTYSGVPPLTGPTISLPIQFGGSFLFGPVLSVHGKPVDLTTWFAVGLIVEPITDGNLSIGSGVPGIGFSLSTANPRADGGVEVYIDQADIALLFKGQTYPLIIWGQLTSGDPGVALVVSQIQAT